MLVTTNKGREPKMSDSTARRINLSDLIVWAAEYVEAMPRFADATDEVKAAAAVELLSRFGAQYDGEIVVDITPDN